MSYENIKITLKAAQGFAFPHCDIRDCKATEGNYQATLFGKKIVNPNLRDLCLELASEIHQLASLGKAKESAGCQNMLAPEQYQQLSELFFRSFCEDGADYLLGEAYEVYQARFGEIQTSEHELLDLIQGAIAFGLEKGSTWSTEELQQYLAHP